MIMTLEETVLANVKTHFGITDTLEDDVIKGLIDRVTLNFKRTYNQDTIHREFRDVIEDCTIRRYNRRGDEGAKYVTTEGHRRDYFELADEFKEWDASIRQFLEGDKPSGSVVRFL